LIKQAKKFSFSFKFEPDHRDKIVVHEENHAFVGYGENEVEALKNWFDSYNKIFDFK